MFLTAELLRLFASTLAKEVTDTSNPFTVIGSTLKHRPLPHVLISHFLLSWRQDARWPHCLRDEVENVAVLSLLPCSWWNGTSLWEYVMVINDIFFLGYF